MLQADFAVITY